MPTEKSPAPDNFRTLADLYRDAKEGDLARHEARIAGASMDALLRLLNEHAHPRKPRDAQRLLRYLIERELTARGLPPFFRGVPEVLDDDQQRVADQIVVDMQWVVARYPKHKPEWASRNRYFARDQFDKVIPRLAINAHKVQPYVVLRGLGLTTVQMAECAWLRIKAARQRQYKVRNAFLEAKRQIRGGFYMQARNRGLSDTETVKLIEARAQLWKIATIYDDSPTQVAQVLSVLTGVKVTRQQAAKQIEKLRRDISRARPRRIDRV